MEELIFFAVIIFFAIIESVARSRRKRAGAQAPQIPGDPEWEPRDEREWRRETPSYDADPSFDAERSFDEVATSDAEVRERTRSSETMIPDDIWEEIAGLARESKPKQEAPARATPPPALPKKAPLPPRPTPPKPAPPIKLKRAPAITPMPSEEGATAHAVHLAHVGYGTDPSERARSAHDAPDPLARTLGVDASGVRNQLRSEGARALRRAVVLKEVLGLPVAMRPDRFSD